jgi:hypothetical protein
VAITQFQGALTIIARARLWRTLDERTMETLVRELVAIETDGSGYGGRLAAWLDQRLVPSLSSSVGPAETIEETVLRAISGATATDAPVNGGLRVDWEGGTYRVDVSGAELSRLRRVRRAQQAPLLDEALEHHRTARGAGSAPRGGRGPLEAAEAELAQALASLVYAASLGEPRGVMFASGDPAANHRLGPIRGSGITGNPWMLAGETFGPAGWRVTGSLLGLDIALARTMLRRLEAEGVPRRPSPMLTIGDRHALMQTVAIVNPFEVDDRTRDAVASAIAQGRRRVAALGSSPADAGPIAERAQLSEWRHNSLRWMLANPPAEIAAEFSLAELVRIGEVQEDGGSLDLDAWGTTATLGGCYCLEFPEPGAWEDFVGRRGTAYITARLPDLMLRLAEALAKLKLPARLVRNLLTFAALDYLEEVRPAHPDDWHAFVAGARAITEERISGYVAAEAAGGALVAAGSPGLPDGVLR